jgi:hypothetical protein
MSKDITGLKNHIDKIELILYQTEHFLADLKNDYKPKDETEKEVLRIIEENFKTLQKELFTHYEIVNQFYTSIENEDYIQLKNIIDNYSNSINTNGKVN